MKTLVYYAHPGHQYSRANKALCHVAHTIDDITFVDLYAEYPRHDIDVVQEQARLNDHDAILFQFPLFWYSAPSLVKEWQDLVLEYDYAYGPRGDALKGKYFGLVLTAGGGEDAYQTDGFQRFPLTTFLTPYQRTAELCQMHYLPPYVYFGALAEPATNGLDAHCEGYRHYLEGLRDDRLPLGKILSMDLLKPEQFITSEAV